MKRLVLISCLMASPVLAQDADPDDVAAMVAAIVDAGCSVTMENGDALLAASGLGADDMTAVVTQLYADGLFTPNANGDWSYTGPGCE